MPSLPNVQDVGHLSRRLRVRVLPKVVFNDHLKQTENQNRQVTEHETCVKELFKTLLLCLILFATV